MRKRRRRKEWSLFVVRNNYAGVPFCNNCGVIIIIIEGED